MTIKILKTYRGKHGLFVQGQVYDLTPGQIAAIETECEDQKTTFQFAKVKDATNFNRPAKQTDTPKNKQQTGKKNKSSDVRR